MSKKNEQALSNSLNLLVRSSVVVFIGIVLSKLLIYAYRLVIARYFGPEAYGVFSLAIMVTGWLVLFSTIGLTQGMTRYISLYRGKEEQQNIRPLIAFSFVVMAITGVVSGILLFSLSRVIAISIFHNTELVVFLQIFSILIPITVIMNGLLSILQAFEKITWYSFILNVVQNVAKLVLLIVFIWLGFELNSIIFSYVLGVIVSLLVAYFVARIVVFRKLTKSKSTKSPTLLRRELFAYSWPLLFFGLVETAFYWADSFIIGYFKNAEAVGIYNSAVPVALLLGLTGEVFMQLFFPLITREYGKHNLLLIKDLSKQVGKWIFTLNLPAVVFIFLFPEVILGFLFGPQYLVAANALRILSVGAFVYSILIVSSKLLSMTGRSKLILIDIASLTGPNVVLNILLVPRYGIEGAALATSISFILLNVLFILQTKYYLNIIPVRRSFAKIMIAAFVSTALLLIIVQKFPVTSIITLAIAGVLYLCVYLLLLFLLRSFDRNDLYVIKGIYRKMLFVRPTRKN